MDSSYKNSAKEIKKEVSNKGINILFKKYPKEKAQYIKRLISK